MKTVAGLLTALPGATLAGGDPETAVTSVRHDTRRVEPGSLFVAISGFKVDSHTLLASAIGAGASALVVQRDRARHWATLDAALPVVAVDDTRAALATASAWFFDYPGRDMEVVGITGTDGKTTTSHLLSSVLETAGVRAGRLGTVDVSIGSEVEANTLRMTTPEANEVQRLMRTMADAGCEVAIVESTSHGLALHRLDHVDYNLALVTNVAGDHLDFHATFEAYREAKSRLFASLAETAAHGQETVAIVNADDPSASFMLEHARGSRHLSFGLETREADLCASNVCLRPDGSDFRIEMGNHRVEASVRLPALFNVSNALAAASAGIALGLDLATVAHGLAACPGVPGRMERVDAGQPFAVVVDFAHTGEAVRKVLEVSRDITAGKLIIVVGAAGERDPGRRYGVARAAAEGADFAVFTNEDPRSEDPGAIVAEIGRHAERAGRTRGEHFIEVDDRREAIVAALGRAQPGDTVLICGKGHEQSMIYGDQSLPWDDRTVTRDVLAALGWPGA